MYNYDTIAILLNYTCLSHLHPFIQELTIYNNISKLYIEATRFENFINEFKELNVTHCILDINFERVFNVQCETKTTNQIYYNINGIETKKPDAWQLDLLDQTLDNSYTYTEANPNIELWILDTGVNWSHKEFDVGQVEDMDPSYTKQNVTHPHGTGTASCAGGKNYGTSKTKIYNMPVCKLGGSCGSSDIDKAFKYIIERSQHNKINNSYIKRFVVNLSFGNNLGYDPLNTTLGKYYDGMFKTMLENGVIVVTSAGNSNENSCMWLYSFSPSVVSVGSIDQNYNKSSFSNHGACVDLWAFGSNVPTAYSVLDNNVVQYKSGTSFSSPMVAGLIVNILSENINLTRDEILGYLYNKVKDYVTPFYSCGANQYHCCRSVKGTRKDIYCRSLSVSNCVRECYVSLC